MSHYYPNNTVNILIITQQVYNLNLNTHISSSVSTHTFQVQLYTLKNINVQKKLKKHRNQSRMEGTRQTPKHVEIRISAEDQDHDRQSV